MIMEITEVKTTVLRASEGKVLRRISDQKVFGSELWLGYTYYLGNKKLDEPLLELHVSEPRLFSPNWNLSDLLCFF